MTKEEKIKALQERTAILFADLIILINRYAGWIAENLLEDGGTPPPSTKTNRWIFHGTEISEQVKFFKVTESDSNPAKHGFDFGAFWGRIWKINGAKDHLNWVVEIQIPGHWVLTNYVKNEVAKGRMKYVKTHRTYLGWKKGWIVKDYRGYWTNEGNGEYWSSDYTALN